MTSVTSLVNCIFRYSEPVCLVDKDFAIIQSNVAFNRLYSSSVIANETLKTLLNHELASWLTKHLDVTFSQQQNFKVTLPIEPFSSVVTQASGVNDHGIDNEYEEARDLSVRHNVNSQTSVKPQWQLESIYLEDIEQCLLIWWSPQMTPNQNNTVAPHWVQSEKMAAIGQLTAGIAHEINNPTGFINSNLQSLRDYFKTMTQTMDFLHKEAESFSDQTLSHKMHQWEADHQINFVLQDVADLIDESIEGANRIMGIVNNLKEFAHVDEAQWQLSSVNQGIESSLKLIHNETKYGISIERNLQPDLPHIYCQPNQLNQVFLNLLVNATQAIETNGVISIQTRQVDHGEVEIQISDNGSGIEADKLDAIFEPFYTTKPIGKGTGLGLSVSKDIIHSHQGSISVSSAIGQGTQFTLRLPIHPSQAQPEPKLNA